MKKILVLLLFVFTLTLAVPAMSTDVYAESHETAVPLPGVATSTGATAVTPAVVTPAPVAAPVATPGAAPAATPATATPGAAAAAAPAKLVCPANTTEVPNVNNQCVSTKKGYKCQGGFVSKGPNAQGFTICEVGTSKEDILSKAQQEDFQKRLSVILAVQAFLNRLLWPVLVMIGGLLDNSLLFGSGMEPRLREIWIPIRNLVNIMFVIVMVGIALYNILGIGDESGNYSLKTALPRIIIGIIAVNFSFLGMKVMLDAVTVMTTAIFSLPGQVSEGLEEVVNSDNPQDIEVIRRFCLKLKNKKVNDTTPTATQAKNDNLTTKRIVAKKYARKYSTTQKKLEITPATTGAEIDTMMKDLPRNGYKEYIADMKEAKSNQFCAGNALTPRGKAFLTRYNSRNAALAMALNMSKIVFYEDIEISTINLRQLFTNTLFSVILYLVYAASFLALFIVLLARMVVLWIAVAISPIFVIGLALPFVKEKLSGFDELQTEFVQNLIAPITIGIAMTVGWIMLRGVQSLDRFDTGSSLNLDPTNGLPVEGLNTLQDLIVAVGVIAVVWVAVFAAANKTVAKGATEWMKGSLQTAGTWLVKTPLKNLPGVAVQIPGEEGPVQVSMPQLGEAIRSLGETDTKDRRAFIDRIVGKTQVPPLRDLNEPTYKNDVNQARKMLKTYQSQLERGDDGAQKEIKKFVTDHGTAWGLLSRDEKTALGKMASTDKSLRTRGARDLFKGTTTKPLYDNVDELKEEKIKKKKTKPDPSEVKNSHINEGTYAGTKVSDMAQTNASVVTAIKSQTQAIVDKLKDPNASKEDLTALLRSYQVDGKRPKASEVENFMRKSLIGNKQAYAMLQEKLGDRAGTPATPAAGGVAATTATSGTSTNIETALGS